MVQPMITNREELLSRLADSDRPWDFVVIGGGATGLGTAVDAAARGYSTLLLEGADFAKGTSSRSTKLIHGGVRYLQQGNVSLVLESLRERGLLMQNAPHLVHHLSFVVPLYDWWEGPFYGIGLKLYDLLAGRLGLGPSKHLTREETLQRIRTLEPRGLRGGILYFDGQFDDARFAVNLARTLSDLGGVPINYMPVTELQKSNGLVDGVIAKDLESGTEYRIAARSVINATGIFTDNVNRMDDPGGSGILTLSQGVHIVLDRSFLPGESAIMVPHTEDGRVLFAIPWQARTLIGTTDTPVEETSLEPRPLPEEVEFLMTHAARYLTRDPAPTDVLSIFAGLRPLIKPGNGGNTSSLSRDHALVVSKSGLVTVTGGKWTTYRKMGEDAVDAAAAVAGLEGRSSSTKHLRIHGLPDREMDPSPWTEYGSDSVQLERIVKENPIAGERLHPNLPYRVGSVIWAVRGEWARTVEDVLARRTRALLLDAKASLEIAPKVAEIMAKELGRDPSWQQQQPGEFRALAKGYILR